MHQLALRMNRSALLAERRSRFLLAIRQTYNDFFHDYYLDSSQVFSLRVRTVLAPHPACFSRPHKPETGTNRHILTCPKACMACTTWRPDWCRKPQKHLEHPLGRRCVHVFMPVCCQNRAALTWRWTRWTSRSWTGPR